MRENCIGKHYLSDPSCTESLDMRRHSNTNGKSKQKPGVSLGTRFKSRIGAVLCAGFTAYSEDHHIVRLPIANQAGIRTARVTRAFEHELPNLPDRT